MLTGRAAGGEPTRSEESSEVRWVPRKDLGGYSMDQSMRLRIGHYLEGRATPYLGLQVRVSMDQSMRLRIGHYLEGRATPYLGLQIVWRAA